MAAGHQTTHLSDSDKRRLGDKARTLSLVSLLVGIVGLLVALLIALGGAYGGMQRFEFAYLTAYMFVLSISVGAMGFLLLTHLFRGGWHVLFRRVPETLAASVVILAVLALPIIGFVLKDDGLLYSWAQPADQIVYPDYYESAAQAHAANASANAPELYSLWTGSERSGHQITPVHAGHNHDHATAASHHHGPDEMLMGKRPWLNIPFFSFRVLVYMLILSVVGLFFWRTSLKQDEDSDPSLTRRMEMFSAPGTLVFALTVTFLCFDLIMTLDWTWYSTIFGVYYFAGAMQTILATTIITLLLFQRAGYFSSVSKEHYHDLGKLLFGFIFFWGYIAYSQYVLLWYASLPGTIPWLAIRGATTVEEQYSPMVYQALLLLFGLFILPFLFLLSRHVKRNMMLLGLAAAWILVMRYVDIHWLIMPQYVAQFPAAERFIAFGPIEIGCLIGLLGIFLAVALRIARPYSLVPVNDPRLHESLRFHNI